MYINRKQEIYITIHDITFHIIYRYLVLIV